MHRMQSNAPTRKLQYGALTSALMVIAVWLLKQNGIIVPSEVAVAMSTVLSFIVAYIVPPAARDQITLAAAP